MGVHSGSPLKWRFLRIVDGKVSKVFTFQYNPTENSEEITPEYDFDQSPGAVLPRAVFRGLGEATMSATLFFDATTGYSEADRGVDSKIAFLKSVVLPDVDRYTAGLKQFISPPEIVLSINDELIPVVVTNIAVRVLRRNGRLHPVRAEVDVSMRRYRSGPDDEVNWLESVGELRDLVETEWIQ